MSYILGLTGGISSGKSTVSRYFIEKKIPVIDADMVAREVVQPGEKGLERIVYHFGTSILQSDGSLNRKKLGNIIFENDVERETLNALLSSEISDRIDDYIAQASKNNPPLIVLDIPLLFEGGYSERVDEIMVIYVSKQTQLKRLMARDNVSREEALSRIDSQLSLEKKARLANVKINNEYSLEDTIRQVELWLTHFYENTK